MTIDYIKLSPTQNITVLVKSAVPRPRQAEVAAWLLSDGAVGGEQVGFIEPPSGLKARARLQMMGGEFCGNAAMSLGVVLAREARLADGEALDIPIEVSGSIGPVSCRIQRTGEAWLGTVRMPLPTRMREIPLTANGEALRVPLVEMPGIAHLILPASPKLDDAHLRKHMPEWCRAAGADALGALTWDGEAAFLDPLVYVPSAGTLVREHGCGSGSAAIGAWLAVRAGRSGRFRVRQPGGIIDVDAEVAGGVLTGLRITGRVELLAEGTVDVPC